MFGNLKNKLGDVADLKKYAAPQLLNSLNGSRQRSTQHTPGTQTPNLSHHSRQSSVSSLQNVGLAAESSPESILEEDEQSSPQHRPNCSELLSLSSDLESANTELIDKSKKIHILMEKLQSTAIIEERVSSLAEEKMELETQLAGLNLKLRASNTQLQSEKEQHEEVVKLLEDKIATISKRNSHNSMQESDKNLALLKEREILEHRLEETCEQLNNIKSSWSNKISSLESQIHNLNLKIADDQLDLKEAEKTISQLKTDISTIEESYKLKAEESKTMQREFNEKIRLLEESVETSKWQLQTDINVKDKEIKDLRRTLHIEEETTIQLKEAVDTKDNECCELKNYVVVLETELQSLKENLSMIQDKNSFLQTSYSTMQENLNHERKINESLNRDYKIAKSKLETISTEKAKLSSNLDNYLDKVNRSEEQIKVLEEQNYLKDESISNLEMQLKNSGSLCSELQLRLSDFEADFDSKVEKSNLVIDLKQKQKAYEDEMEEKRQMIKVQSQRLADMKKTLQRELKRNVDILDTAYDSGGSTTVSPRPSINEPAKLPYGGMVGTSLSSYADLNEHHQNGTEDEELINFEYLKHVLMKFLTSREYEAVHLTRAVATLLHMTPEEEKYLKESLEYRMSWFGSRPNFGKGQLSKIIPPSP